jgi:uncharacterized protein involved in outer membrane biogenesis
MKTSAKRALAIGGIAVLVLAAAASAGLHFATRALKNQVEQALGTDSEVGEIAVGWSSIEVRGVRVRAPQGWPAEDALRAERVIVKPDLAGLLSARVHVPRIIIDKAYVSVWRTRDGKLHLLPGLLEKPAQAGAQDASAPSSAPPVTIGGIELREGVLEFFDSSVRQPAHKTRLEQLHTTIDDLRIPALDSRSRITMDGMVKGVQHNGRLAVDGWAEIAQKNSDISLRLAGVDLVALQPYLIKAAETGVKRGSLDLSLKSTVHNNRLHAPGMITLNNLELAPTGSGFGTFMGIPRQSVVGALKNRNGQIAIHFTLDGNLDDPAFSLNESFARRVGASVAESLGISIEGLTRGIGGAAEGIGGAVKRLFGK